MGLYRFTDLLFLYGMCRMFKAGECTSYFDWVSAPGTVRACVGNDVTIMWSYNSSQTMSDFHWRRGSTTLNVTQDSAMMSLRNVSKSDAGKYVLGFGTLDDEPAVLEVIDASEIELTLKINSQNVSFGSEYTTDLENLTISVLSNIDISTSIMITPSWEQYQCSSQMLCEFQYRIPDAVMMYIATFRVQYGTCAPVAHHVTIRKIRTVVVQELAVPQVFEGFTIAVQESDSNESGSVAGVISSVIFGILSVPLALFLALVIIVRKRPKQRSPSDLEFLGAFKVIVQHVPFLKDRKERGTPAESEGRFIEDLIRKDKKISDSFMGVGDLSYEDEMETWTRVKSEKLFTNEHDKVPKRDQQIEVHKPFESESTQHQSDATHEHGTPTEGRNGSESTTESTQKSESEPLKQTTIKKEQPPFGLNSKSESKINRKVQAIKEEVESDDDVDDDDDDDDYDDDDEEEEEEDEDVSDEEDIDEKSKLEKST